MSLKQSSITDFMPREKRKEGQGTSNQSDKDSVVQDNEEADILELYEAEIKESTSKARGPYKKYTDAERAAIGRYAVRYGTASAVRKFSSKGMNESTVRSIREKYKEMAKEQGSDLLELKKSNKCGRPLKLGQLDNDVQRRLRLIRESGGRVDSRIALAIGRAVVKVKAPDESININRGWARSIFNRMGFTQRAVTTGKLSLPELYIEEKKFTFLNEIATYVVRDNIPKSMILNWDQTPLQYVPTSKYTMAQCGSSKIDMAGAGDKRSLTAVFTVTLDGKFLPMQLIYKGKTTRSLPEADFPPGFHVTCNDNHWSNEATMLAYIEHILKPYISSERIKHGESQPALLLYDAFRAHCTENVQSALLALNARLVMVPKNMTDHLQPLDLSVNKPAKQYLTNDFSKWYSEKVLELEQEDGLNYSNLSDLLKSSVKLRELSAQWIGGLYKHFQLPFQREIIIHGFEKAGISDIILSGPKPDDPFA